MLIWGDMDCAGSGSWAEEKERDRDVDMPVNILHSVGDAVALGPHVCTSAPLSLAIHNTSLAAIPSFEGWNRIPNFLHAISAARNMAPLVSYKCPKSSKPTYFSEKLCYPEHLLELQRAPLHHFISALTFHCLFIMALLFF